MQRGARVLRRVWRPISAPETAARNTRRKKRGALASRCWLNAFIGDAPREKNQGPQSSHRHCPTPFPCVRGRTQERGGKGCVGGSGGWKGARGCEPFLRHYVIRRFPRGIPTASTDDGESRNFVATKRFLPGNNTPPPSFCTYPPLLAILEG